MPLILKKPAQLKAAKADESHDPSAPHLAPTIIEENAEAWIECAQRLFATAWDDIAQVDDGWNKQAKLSNRGKPYKNELLERCKKAGGSCSGAMDRKELIEALLKTQVGPDVPPGGVRICNPGIAIGYDVELMNPAWSAYRLNKKEQKSTDNDRRNFVQDPGLTKAHIRQTSQDLYANTNFDKGHLAPSLAMSFDRTSLVKAKRSPWLSSYYQSNIAPQYSEMNQRAWQTLEEALHEYALKLPRDSDSIYEITGVGYWDRNHVRRWAGPRECNLDCPCAGTCECHTCAAEHIRVPSFYWKVACVPDRGSFAVIAENDPESSHLEGGKKGWPPSVFELYTAQNVEHFFGVHLNLPKTCTPEKKTALIPDWTSSSNPPLGPSSNSSSSFDMELLGIGGNRVKFREKVWIRFVMPFGPSADFHNTLVVRPPPVWTGSSWTAMCDSLVVQQLPAVKSCKLGWNEEVQLQFGSPIKGGTFVFKLQMEAPSAQPQNTGWRAFMKGGSTFEPQLTHTNFEILPDQDRSNTSLGFFALILCLLVVVIAFMSQKLRSRRLRKLELKAELEKEHEEVLRLRRSLRCSRVAGP
jgi:DNA/RNA endonuclease G (NUC1)